MPSTQWIFRSAALVAAAVVAVPLGAQTIDTRNGQPLPVGGYALGATESAYGLRTIGQSFVTPAGATSLTSFSFFLSRGAFLPGGANDFTFVARLQAFTPGGIPVGPVLFASAPRTLSASTPLNVVAEELFTTGGTAVTPGATYVAYLAALDAPSTGGRFVSYYATDQYAPGRVYGATDGDLAFVAQFAGTTVPEPGTWLLVATGCAVLGASVRRRT
jgi:hypothetical protein